MEQQQISPKKQKALEKVKRANAELAKVVREKKEQLRKTQDRHKYMMGGCVVKYFPEAYDFSEQEMNRKELDGLKESYRKTERPLSDAIVDLAKMEVLNHNHSDFYRYVP